MRVSNANDFFRFLGKNYPEAQRHLLARLPAEVLDAILRAPRTDWIPAELDGQYVDEVFAVLGFDGGRDAYRRFTHESLVHSPTLRSIFDGLTRLFGVSVGTYLRAVPGGFRQSYRDALSVRVQRGDHAGTVFIEDIAVELLRFRSYPDVWHGTFLGLYDLAHAEPQLELHVDRPGRRVEIALRW
jgi:hypothetical protein